MSSSDSQPGGGHNPHDRYEPPDLRVLGTLQELTRAGGASGSDLIEPTFTV